MVFLRPDIVSRQHSTYHDICVGPTRLRGITWRGNRSLPSSFSLLDTALSSAADWGLFYCQSSNLQQLNWPLLQCKSGRNMRNTRPQSYARPVQCTPLAHAIFWLVNHIISQAAHGSSGLSRIVISSFLKELSTLTGIGSPGYQGQLGSSLDQIVS